MSTRRYAARFLRLQSSTQNQALNSWIQGCPLQVTGSLSSPACCEWQRLSDSRIPLAAAERVRAIQYCRPARAAHQLWSSDAEQQTKGPPRQRGERNRRHTGPPRTDNTAHSSLTKLNWKSVMALRPHEMQQNMTLVLEFLHAEYRLASLQQLQYPVPVLLQRVGKIFKKVPALRHTVEKIRSGAMDWQKLIRKQCHSPELYASELSISQLASSQATFGVYSSEFWEQLGNRKFVFRMFLPAVTVVHAYANLYDSGLAGKPSDNLRHVLLTAVDHHLEDLNALGFSNMCWSLGKLQMPGWERLWPRLQASCARKCRQPNQLSPEDVTCIAYALGEVQKPLGPAHEPFIDCVAHAATSMNAKQVSRIMRAFASMNLSLGRAYSSLMQAVEREVCTAPLSTGALPHQVVTFTAFADSKIPVCSAHEALVCSLLSSVGNMNPPFVAATFHACGKMVEAGGTHQKLVQPLKAPLLGAVATSCAKMDARAVCSAIEGAAKLGSGLQEARQPLATAVVRELQNMPPWGVSAALMSCAVLKNELVDRFPWLQSALSSALQSGSLAGLRNMHVAQQFWAMGTLKMDPGESTSEHMLDILEQAEGIDVQELEQVAVGLSWMLELYKEHALQRRVSGALDSIQDRLNN